MKKRKWALNLLFLGAVMGATIWGVFRGSDMDSLLKLVRSADWRWWLLGFGLVVLFIGGESLVLHRIMGTLRTPHRLTHCFLYSFVGFFFSCITPSAGGGQPAQVCFMKKDGINASVSVPVLILVTITYKLVLVLYGIVVFLLRPAGVMAALEPVIWWCWLGLVLNALFVAGALVLIFRPEAVERCLRLGLRLWERLSRGNKLEQRMERLQVWMGKYRSVSYCFQSHWGMILRITALTVLQRSTLFAVTYVALRSFGIAGISLGTAIVLQAMISLGTDLLPLPGGMGASETMFLWIFSALCGAEQVLPVLLVSRGISYYGQLLISAVFTVAAVFLLGRHERGEVEYDRIL